jgi:hypothetical protein
MLLLGGINLEKLEIDWKKLPRIENTLTGKPQREQKRGENKLNEIKIAWHR